MISTSPSTAPDPFAAPVAQLLTGDDQADTAAALWAGQWGWIWSPTTVGVRTVPAVDAAAPSLAVVGLPVAGTGVFVSAAAEIAALCNVPTACVPWYLAEVPAVAVEHAVVAVLWGGDDAAVTAVAQRMAVAAGRPLSVLELGASTTDRDAAAARLAAEQHLGSVLVVGVGGPAGEVAGRWVAGYTIAPTLLVPTARATAPRTPPPASGAPSRVSPAVPTRSS